MSNLECDICNNHYSECICDQIARDEIQERIAIALEGILQYLEKER